MSYEQEQKKSIAINQEQAASLRPEPHMVYELKQQREYHLRKLMDIQAAIDAVNRTQY